jgi:threonyl-tRNA synthetase
MYNMQLWETSGHAANYKDNMFVFEVRFVLCFAAMILIINLLYLCFIMKETNQVWRIKNWEAKTSGLN